MTQNEIIAIMLALKEAENVTVSGPEYNAKLQKLSDGDDWALLANETYCKGYKKAIDNARRYVTHVLSLSRSGLLTWIREQKEDQERIERLKAERTREGQDDEA